MKKSDSDRIKRLNIIASRALKFFVVAGITAMAIATVGAFIAAIIAGLIGSRDWIYIVFVISGFVAAGSAFSYALALIMLIRITVIKLRSKSLKLRSAISSFIAEGFMLSLALFATCGVVWWAVKILTNPDILGLH